jgi:hypothetical protein
LVELNISISLKMETASFSETLRYFYKFTWHHIPEDRNVHIHCSENLDVLMMFGENIRFIEGKVVSVLN